MITYQEEIRLPSSLSQVSGELQKLPLLLTVREVAKFLRVDGTTVRRWIELGALSAVYLPARGDRRKYRILRSTIEKLFEV